MKGITMQTRIRELEDNTAIQILMTIAKREHTTDAITTQRAPEILDLLASQLGAIPSTEKITQGGAARQALLLLSESPEYQAPLTALVNGPETERFSVDPITTTAVITAALVILQTHVKFERDKQGKYSFKVEKKATSEQLLKPLVQKLLALMKLP
jgi:hypothetical protein